MRALKGNKGITLVALIITIIVLLILAVVSIRAVTGDGIIQYAKNAKAEYQAAQVNESETLDSYLAELDTNADFLATIQIGDKVAYNEGYSAAKTSTVDLAFTMDNLEWRVLDVEDDGTVELISTKPTTSTLTLSGEDGWLKAEENLDTLCSELYANGEGVTARSLKVEDVDKLAGILTEEDKAACESPYGSLWRYKYDATAAKIQYSKSTDNGANWTDYANTSYAKFKAPGEAEINSTNYQDIKGNPIVNEKTYTSYGYTVSSKVTQTTSDGISIADLITKGLNDINDGTNISNQKQWMSSRSFACSSSRIWFRVKMINDDGRVGDYNMFSSNGDSNSPAYAVRPVVSLPSSALGEKVNGVWRVAL